MTGEAHTSEAPPASTRESASPIAAAGRVTAAASISSSVASVGSPAPRWRAAVSAENRRRVSRSAASSSTSAPPVSTAISSTEAWAFAALTWSRTSRSTSSSWVLHLIEVSWAPEAPDVALRLATVVASC
jgi:hypothetical protein